MHGRSAIPCLNSEKTPYNSLFSVEQVNLTRIQSVFYPRLCLLPGSVRDDGAKDTLTMIVHLHAGLRRERGLGVSNLLKLDDSVVRVATSEGMGKRM